MKTATGEHGPSWILEADIRFRTLPSLAFYRCAWPTDFQRTAKALEIETKAKMEI
jgi:hypothetical protein